MTFTILGRDPSTGELGRGIATYSLAVGATCPQMSPGIGVVTSQASTNPVIGEEIDPLFQPVGIDAMGGLVEQVSDRLTRLGQSHRTAPSGARPIISA